MDFYIICVLYNKEIKDINSLAAFLEFRSIKKNINIMIFDNSIDTNIVNKNKKYKNSAINYYYNDGNLGLSKVYNLGLKKINSKSYAVMLADDDTNFSIDYLLNAYDEILQRQTHIVTGIILSNGKVMSPKKSIYEPSFVNQPGSYKNIYAINSGLVFDDFVVSQLGEFDERLFLDMIDFWFAKKVFQLGIEDVCVVIGNIEQDFSGSQKRNINAEKKRFQIYSNDVKSFIEIFPEEKAKMKKVLLKRWININVIHRLKK